MNGDRSADTILDCEIAAAIKFHEEVAAAGTVDKVAVVRFNSGASAIGLDPTCSKAATTRRRASRACAPTSSPPTAPPPSAAAVVPATDTDCPTHTAREYPTTGSHITPELTNYRCVMASSCPVASKELGQVRWTIRSG